MSDGDGDRMTVAATARATNGTNAAIPLTPASSSVDGSGTATFDISLTGTNAEVTVTVSDGRGGSVSRSIEVGDDYTREYCQTG